MSASCRAASTTSRSICGSGRRPTGSWDGATLTAEGGEQLFVPRGFAHGFCTLEPDTVVAYKVDEFYAPASDSGTHLERSDARDRLAGRPGEAVLSDKDQKLGRFADFESPFRYEGQ